MARLPPLRRPARPHWGRMRAIATAAAAPELWRRRQRHAQPLAARSGVAAPGPPPRGVVIALSTLRASALCPVGKPALCMPILDSRLGCLLLGGKEPGMSFLWLGGAVAPPAGQSLAASWQCVPTACQGAQARARRRTLATPCCPRGRAATAARQPSQLPFAFDASSPSSPGPATQHSSPTVGQALEVRFQRWSGRQPAPLRARCVQPCVTALRAVAPARARAGFELADAAVNQPGGVSRRRGHRSSSRAK
jgi:hypothetical protein